MKHLLILYFVALCSLLSVSAKADSNEIKLATTGAERWVNQLDQSQYDSTWSSAAEIFKKSVSQAQWTQVITGVRPPLGKVIERKLQAAELKTSLPGAPDGRYVVVQFKTRFENKQEAIETIVPMLEKDGQWRVSGYFIR
jgi:hypothetical protein